MKYPKNHPKYFESGKAKFEAGDYAGAIDDYSKAIELDPNNAQAYFNRGLAKNELKIPGAAEDYMTAVELDPDNAETYFIRGLDPLVANEKCKLGGEKHDSNNFQGAIEEYTKAISLVTEDPMPYLLRGRSKQSLGDLKGACEDWKKAKELGLEEVTEVLKVLCTNI